jgi:hypothetical protein
LNGGAGGGGAGGVGSAPVNIDTGGPGGDAVSNSITGSAVAYAGGGGGSSNTYSGLGGPASGSPSNSGGSGGSSPAPPGAGQPGVANTGGGGGGCYDGNPAAPGAGGKGVVILKIPTESYSGKTTGSPTVTTSGTDTIVKFTGAGTYTT